MVGAAAAESDPRDPAMSRAAALVIASDRMILHASKRTTGRVRTRRAFPAHHRIT
jgi:hypothetical protein